MMPLSMQILLAFGLDLVLGDPRWFPHPVRIIGKAALALEKVLRRPGIPARPAGVLMVLLVVGGTALVGWSLLWAADWLHPLLGDLAGILMIYFCLASRDLHDHANRVLRALRDGDLPRARREVSWLVSRDTEHLDASEVARAATESVAENLSDGVVAPLLFAALLGPAGALIYKAANTLDSLFGYKNADYLKFGWASARFDDLMNLVPARTSAWLVMMAAPSVQGSLAQSFRVWFRDHARHPSPNSGHPEAAFAGAMGVRFGGENMYFGRPGSRPLLGDPRESNGPRTLARAMNLMMAASLLACVLAAGIAAVLQMTL